MLLHGVWGGGMLTTRIFMERMDFQGKLFKLTTGMVIAKDENRAVGFTINVCE